MITIKMFGMEPIDFMIVHVPSFDFLDASLDITFV